jgi:hypothetical protein
VNAATFTQLIACSSQRYFNPLDRHKFVSWHRGHRPEDSLVQRRLAKLVGHVFGYRPDCRNHLLSLFLKKFRVHESLLATPSELRQ